jgi:hypothetical protein
MKMFQKYHSCIGGEGVGGYTYIFASRLRDGSKRGDERRGERQERSERRSEHSQWSSFPRSKRRHDACWAHQSAPVTS